VARAFPPHDHTQLSARPKAIYFSSFLLELVLNLTVRRQLLNSLLMLVRFSAVAQKEERSPAKWKVGASALGLPGPRSVLGQDSEHHVAD